MRVGREVRRKQRESSGTRERRISIRITVDSADRWPGSPSWAGPHHPGLRPALQRLHFTRDAFPCQRTDGVIGAVGNPDDRPCAWRGAIWLVPRPAPSTSRQPFPTRLGSTQLPLARRTLIPTLAPPPRLARRRLSGSEPRSGEPQQFPLLHVEGTSAVVWVVPDHGAAPGHVRRFRSRCSTYY